MKKQQSNAAGRHREKVPGRPFVPGDPRINRTIGGPGRPPQEPAATFAAWCRQQLETPQGRRKLQVRMWLVDKQKRPNILLIKALAYAYGQPVVKVDVTQQYDLTRLTKEQLIALVQIGEAIAFGGAARLPQPASVAGTDRGGQTTH